MFHHKTYQTHQIIGLDWLDASQITLIPRKKNQVKDFSLINKNLYVVLIFFFLYIHNFFIKGALTLLYS